MLDLLWMGGRDCRNLLRSAARQAPGHWGDEAVSPTVYGLDHTLCTSIVTHSLARFCDAVRERCFADELLGPQLRIQLFARDELVMVLDEVGEQIEHFWFEVPASLPGRAHGGRCRIRRPQRRKSWLTHRSEAIVL